MNNKNVSIELLVPIFNEENSLKGGVVKGDLYDKLLNMCGGKQKTNAKSKKRGRNKNKNKKKKNKTRKI